MAANPDGFASIEEAVASVAAYNPIRRATTNPDGLRKNLRIREDGRLHWHWDPRAFIGSSPSAPSALIKELSAETNKELPKICENISAPTLRSEERRVGKECGSTWRSRCAQYQYTK